MLNLTDNIKNLYGWRTKRKIIVFSVDDYGNVRLSSKEAQDNLIKAGLKINNRYDAFDSLETVDDLEALFETLRAVKDCNNNAAIFSAFSLPVNIDFSAVKDSGYQSYQYETLPVTFNKLQGSLGTFELWQEGIDEGIFNPQFHGREHLNLSVFNFLLAKKDKELVANIENNSYTSISTKPWKNINYTEAFSFQKLEENQAYASIIKDGLKQFRNIFGYQATVFMPPGGKIYKGLYKDLLEGGITSIETSFFQREHQGSGRHKSTINYTGKQTLQGQTSLVRNCKFEPTLENGTNWVDHCLKQIETSFYWHRPAIISSHRVNFVGGISLKNRKIGLENLQSLLTKIISKWPDAEFMSSAKLGELVIKNKT